MKLLSCLSDAIGAIFETINKLALWFLEFIGLVAFCVLKFVLIGIDLILETIITIIDILLGKDPDE